MIETYTCNYIIDSSLEINPLSNSENQKQVVYFSKFLTNLFRLFWLTIPIYFSINVFLIYTYCINKQISTDSFINGATLHIKYL